MIQWAEIQFKEAVYQYSGIDRSRIKMRLRGLWAELEQYIEKDPEFARSLIPVKRKTVSSPLAEELIEASALAGTGPMAGVAGCFAEWLCKNRSETDSWGVNNGGDLYLSFNEPLYLGIWAGKESPFNALALKVTEEFMPGAFCSSSGKMGHSYSKGQCDLALIHSDSGALADCAATEASNRITSESDLKPVADFMGRISGITGGLLIKNKSISLFGKMPELIKIDRDSLENRIMVYNAHYQTERTPRNG